VVAIAFVVSVLFLGAGLFLLTHLSLFGAVIALAALAVLWAVVRFLLPWALTDRWRRRGVIDDPPVSAFEERQRQIMRERFHRDTEDNPTLR